MSATGDMIGCDAAWLRAEFVRAGELMRQGSLDAADAVLTQALVQAPGDADALYLRGVIANRRRDHGTAIAILRQAIAARPAAALAWLALGNAYARSEQLAAAVDAYREVLAREPKWPDAHYNLGLMLKQQGELPDAARAFHAAWILEPSLPEAAKQCVATTAAWVRADSAAPVVAPVEFGSVRASFSIVICSIDETKLERVVARFRNLFAGVDHEIVSIRNARSLAESYNWAVRHSSSDIIVLSHDDVDILAPNFAQRLLRHLRRFDAVGIVGGVRMTGPAPLWSGHPYLRGWVTHRLPGDPAWRADVLDPRAVAGDVVVLDGVFLAAHRAVFTAVPFDAQAFDGFHLYDADWSYRASQKGFRLGTAGDLLLVHESRGRYDERWQRYADRFCAKHALGQVLPPTQGPFYEATFDNADQVRAFYARLTELQN